MEEAPVKIFLDANILFSASLPGSRLASFLKELSKRATLITNDYAEIEARRNLANKKAFPEEALTDCMSRVKLHQTVQMNLSIELAGKDLPILAGAISSRADILLTGDKRDFGHLFGKTIYGVTVLNVNGLLAWLRDRGMIQ